MKPFMRIMRGTQNPRRIWISWLAGGLALTYTACASKYQLSSQSIPTAYGNPRTLQASLEPPKGWKTPGPGKDDIAFQPANCQRPDCPIISAVLYVGNPYDPIPTQAESAKDWLSLTDQNVVVKTVSSFSTHNHGMLTIYHFSSPNIKEQLATFIIHNHETVAVTLSNLRNGDFQAYMEAMKQVARSIRFRE